MTQRQRLMLGSILAGAVLGAAPVYAQAAPAADAAAADQGIGDIVVTAQRRAQRLQDVPVSVAAADAKALEAIGIQSTSDLSRLTPGVDIQFENGAAAPTLRGVSTANTAGDESPIAIYVDGVYQPTLGAGLFALNSIERVEILKGPQGTLFGRNAAGGVIQIITRTPQHDPKADLNLSYANYKTFTGNGYLSGGLSDNVAADLALYYTNQRKGWGRNLVTGDGTYKAKEFAARSKVLIDLSDRTQVTLIGSYDRRESGQGTNQRVIPPYVALDGTTQNFGFYNTAESFPGNYIGRLFTGSAKISHDGDVARFVSQTSYQTAKIDNFLDLEHTALPLINVDTEHLKNRTFTQEFQVLSPEGSHIKWIVGAFYFNDRPEHDPLRITGLAFTPFSEQRIYARQRTQSYSGFGEMTVPLGERTNATGGIRYTSDQRKFDYSQFLDAFQFSAGNDRKTYKKVTYRGTLDHKFTDDVMVFGTVSRGFKSGLFNITAPGTPVVAPETLDSYEIGIKSDLFDRRLRINVSGFYYDFKNIQLQQVVGTVTSLYNAATSRMKGVDVEIVAAPAEGLRLQAAAEYLDAKYKKFPNAAFYTPNVNAMGVQVGGLSPFAGNASGNRMVRAPKFTASLSGQYGFDTSLGGIELSANYNYNSGYYWDPQNVIRQPRTNLLGASVKWTSLDKRFDVRLWGKNLTKERYFSYVAAQTTGYTGSSAEPRTYGVTMGAHF